MSKTAEEPMSHPNEVIDCVHERWVTLQLKERYKSYSTSPRWSHVSLLISKPQFFGLVPPVPRRLQTHQHFRHIGHPQIICYIVVLKVLKVMVGSSEDSCLCSAC